MSDKMWVTQVTHQQLAYQILCHLSLFSAINKYTHMIYMCVCVCLYTFPFMSFYSGIPAMVDLAAMRDAVAKHGVDPSLVNPKCPTDLIVDHSLQIDYSKWYVCVYINCFCECEFSVDYHGESDW